MKRLHLLALAIVSVATLHTSKVASAEARHIRGGKRVWTVDEIVTERKTEEAKGKVKYCSGGVFKPCVCPSYVTKLVQYRPSIKECGNRAGVVTSGKYIGVFSVVVRDVENKDRWPTSGFGGCTAYERDILGLNKCSAFKVQKRFTVTPEDGRNAEVHCLGASGYSTLFKKVRRITIKIADAPGSNADPLARLCLVGPTTPLN